MTAACTLSLNCTRACVSLQEPNLVGCLLELTWNGQKPVSLGGTTRRFLEDGDEVTFTGFCKVQNLELSISMFYISLAFSYYSSLC